MQALLEQLKDTDEVGLVGFGQSNRRPWGHRDLEGFVAAPHLRLRAAGKDLTIRAIVGDAGKTHGAAGSTSIVTVAEALVWNEWINGELRLVQHEHGDSVTSALRIGHAKVLGSVGSGVNTTAINLSFDTADDRVVWPSHGRRDGSIVVFTTTGTLPGLTAGRFYYVRDVEPHSFKVSADPWGTAVTLSGGAGDHTATWHPYLLVEWLSDFQVDIPVTWVTSSPGVMGCTHELPPGSTVTFSTGGGSLPPEITAGQSYYVVLPGPSGFYVSATYGGLPINFTGGGGTATCTPEMLAYVAGYVHLHDRFNSYDNVLVVTPYQPVEPGDYPSGVPVVPGTTLAADVAGYADCALALPFAWNEGIEGYGHVGTGTVTGTVLTLSTGGPLKANLFAGGFLRVGSAKGRVTSNTASTVTVDAWIPGNPGSGTLAFHLHLPHWRNNPHHYLAGEGFLYPSDDMQPGGASAGSTGNTYSRPRGHLVGSYVGLLWQYAPADTAVSSLGYARSRAASAGDFTVSIASGKLRIARASAAASDPTTGLLQFEDFLRIGNVVNLGGMGQTPSVNGNWRVAAMGHTYSPAGSYIDLTQLSGTDPEVPSSVSGTVPAGAIVTRMFTDRQHRFGSLLETCFRMAVALGRRVVACHLGINSAGQVFATINNAFGFQGKIGWRDDDDSLDWTPSNPDGLAARLRRLIEFIAPRAVQASLGTSRTWKVLAIDGWQGEADSLSQAGRELAERSIPTFAGWLRHVIEQAVLSPYQEPARIPFQWALLPHEPWELVGWFYGQYLTGDVDGLVNAALGKWRILDGFAATVATDDSPKLDGTTYFGTDPLHFNGTGAALNGKAVADALLPLIEFAFSFGWDEGVDEVCNEALALIGEAADIDMREMATDEVSRLCRLFYPRAHSTVLQRHAWTFATGRVQPEEVDNPTSTWAYAYAVPPDLLNVNWVLDPDADDDLQIHFRQLEQTGTPVLQPQPLVQNATAPFRLETDRVGNRVLLTDQEAAVVRYTRRNVPVARWDPHARDALVFRLSHLLAGPVVKGENGIAISQRFLQMSEGVLQSAAAQNASGQIDVRPQPRCEWLP